MYSKIKLFRTLSSHLIALMVFGLSAQAVNVTFHNPAQGPDGVDANLVNIGDRISTTTNFGYQYSDDFGGWTPDVALNTTGLNVYRDWDVDDGTGGTVTHNGALYKSGTDTTFGFNIIADPNYEVSLRKLEVALFDNDTLPATVSLNYKIIYSNDGTTFDNTVLDTTRNWSSIQSTTTNNNNVDNTINWAAGTYRARAIRVEFDLTNIADGLRPNFGITSLGFEQHAVPEPSSYGLFMGLLIIGSLAYRKLRA